MREIMASLGIRSVNEMVGRVDMLDMNHAIDHWKASGIDLTSILTPAKVVFENTGFYKTIEQDHGLDKALDNELIRARARRHRERQCRSYRTRRGEHKPRGGHDALERGCQTLESRDAARRHD